MHYTKYDKNLIVHCTAFYYNIYIYTSATMTEISYIKCHGNLHHDINIISKNEITFMLALKICTSTKF